MCFDVGIPKKLLCKKGTISHRTSVVNHGVHHRKLSDSFLCLHGLNISMPYEFFAKWEDAYRIKRVNSMVLLTAIAMNECDFLSLFCIFLVKLVV